ncbi:hypothetical protein F3F96_08170 [Mariprofundus sp. NF]|uniref:hypothetical protein n=1 Tax=Mariprofundus sp. NF TaxID=2608716 RepID=UPI0015A29E21|nr:hypothetical protein [Mariprofundus sp. NF]NWF39107.1 hypothetical protein [Mariprofundus sp. NF]
MASRDANHTVEERIHRMESLRAANIQVDSGSEWRCDEGDVDAASASIAMFGLPAGDAFTARSALISFFPDGDKRIVEPAYDAAQQQIRIFYPLSQFEGQVEILKAHGEVICTYLESTAMPYKNSAFVHGNSPVPEKLH